VSNRVTSLHQCTQVSCFSVLENLSQLAVGLANGAVIFIRGDISRDRFTKQKVIHKGEHPITGLDLLGSSSVCEKKHRPTRSVVVVVVAGLGFREHTKTTYLFVVSSNSIDCYTTQGKEQREELDMQGCELGCAIVGESDQEMILGRTEAVYFYGPEGRGACFIFDGPKKILAWFRNYLIVVGKDSKVGGGGGSVTSGTAQQISRMNGVNVYDLKNKFIGWSGVVNDVTHVINEWGSIFVVTGDRQIFQLEEKDTSTKLDMVGNSPPSDFCLRCHKRILFYFFFFFFFWIAAAFQEESVPGGHQPGPLCPV